MSLDRSHLGQRLQSIVVERFGRDHFQLWQSELPKITYENTLMVFINSTCLNMMAKQLSNRKLIKIYSHDGLSHEMHYRSRIISLLSTFSRFNRGRSAVRSFPLSCDQGSRTVLSSGLSPVLGLPQSGHMSLAASLPAQYILSVTGTGDHRKRRIKNNRPGVVGKFFLQRLNTVNCKMYEQHLLEWDSAM